MLHSICHVFQQVNVRSVLDLFMLIDGPSKYCLLNLAPFLLLYSRLMTNYLGKGSGNFGTGVERGRLGGWQGFWATHGQVSGETGSWDFHGVAVLLLGLGLRGHLVGGDGSQRMAFLASTLHCQQGGVDDWGCGVAVGARRGGWGQDKSRETTGHWCAVMDTLSRWTGWTSTAIVALWTSYCRPISYCLIVYQPFSSIIHLKQRCI